MLDDISAFHSVLVEFEHSSGGAGSKMLAAEPGVYRLFAKKDGKPESAVVLVGTCNEVLEQSVGSRVRFVIDVVGASSPVSQAAAAPQGSKGHLAPRQPVRARKVA